MSESETPVINNWEATKKKALALGLAIVIRGNNFVVENGENEKIYFTAINLHELRIYVSGYECGNRDAFEAKS